jgi:hypothetical protein
MLPTNPNLSDAAAVYRTSSLDLAAFLKAQGHPIISTDPASGSLIEFVFSTSKLIHADVETYYTGTAQVRPLQLFETYHSLRSMVLTLRHAVRKNRGVA